MKTLIIKTNKQTLEVINNNDGTINILNGAGKQIPNIGNFINSMGGVDSILSNCIEIDTTFSEYIQERNIKLKEAKENRLANQLNSLKEAYAIIENEKSTVQEVFRAYQSTRKIDTGWFASDKAFLENKKVKAFLLAKIGSYTITPFDNGEVIIKTDKEKYSNIRHFGYKSMYDLFEVEL